MMSTMHTTQGVVATGILFYVQGVVMRSRGPVFVTAFNPLRMIIVVILAIPILGDKLYLGRYLPIPTTFIHSFIITGFN